MKIDRRITNGLAWAGVLLVIGVPAADLLSAQFAGETAAPVRAEVASIAVNAPVPAPLSQRPAAPVERVAVVTPTKPAAVTTATPAKATPVAAKPAAAPVSTAASVVDKFVRSGKALPSYITEAGTQPAKVAIAAPARTPTVTTTAPVVAVDPMEVASIPAQSAAPMPMPLSMRPTAVKVPLATALPAATAPGAIVLPPELVARPQGTVTAADLDDWETGPLSEFLARKQGRAPAEAYAEPEYDADGFFLDEGPNRQRGDRVVGWEDQGFSFFAD